MTSRECLGSFGDLRKRMQSVPVARLAHLARMSTRQVVRSGSVFLYSFSA
jgi:hypothetical protein